MFASWLRFGLTSGRVTTSYPKNREVLLREHSSWHTVPRLDATAARKPTPTLQDVKAWAMRCPTSALFVWSDESGWGISLDEGACIGCNRCVVPNVQRVTEWGADVDLFALDRLALVDSVRLQGGDFRDGQQK